MTHKSPQQHAYTSVSNMNTISIQAATKAHLFMLFTLFFATAHRYDHSHYDDGNNSSDSSSNTTNRNANDFNQGQHYPCMEVL